MSLSSSEFIRRFLMHTLPSGFVRIRYYGFLANRYRQERLAQCRSLLGVKTEMLTAPAEPAASTEIDDPVPKHQICPVCKHGRLVIVEAISANPPLRPPFFLLRRPDCAAHLQLFPERLPNHDALVPSTSIARHPLAQTSRGPTRAPSSLFYGPHALLHRALPIHPFLTLAFARTCRATSPMSTSDRLPR